LNDGKIAELFRRLINCLLRMFGRAGQNQLGDLPADRGKIGFIRHSRPVRVEQKLNILPGVT